MSAAEPPRQTEIGLDHDLLTEVGTGDLSENENQLEIMSQIRQ